MRHLLLDPARSTPSARWCSRSGGRARRTIRSGPSAELFNTIAFVAHPYRLADDRARPGRRAADRASDLRSWYDTYYRPNNAIVAVVGDFRAAELLGRSGPASAPYRAAPRPPRVAVAEPEQRGERRVWLRKEAQLSVVFIGLSGAELTGRRTPIPLEVLSAVLSDGRDVAASTGGSSTTSARALEAGGRLLAPHPRAGHVHLLRDACCPDRAVDEAGDALSRPSWSSCAGARSPTRSSSAPRTSWKRATSSARIPSSTGRRRSLATSSSEAGVSARRTCPGSGRSRARTCGEWPSAYLVARAPHDRDPPADASGRQAVALRDERVRSSPLGRSIACSAEGRARQSRRRTRAGPCTRSP